jgi:hypothetical protein
MRRCTCLPRTAWSLPALVIAPTSQAIAASSKSWLRDWRSQWGDYDEVVEQLIDLGDGLVTRTKITTRGERSGVELTRTAGNHFHISDGKVTRWDAYFDYERAATDLGLARKVDAPAS